MHLHRNSYGLESVNVSRQMPTKFMSHLNGRIDGQSKENNLGLGRVDGGGRGISMVRSNSKVGLGLASNQGLGSKGMSYGGIRKNNPSSSSRVALASLNNQTANSKSSSITKAGQLKLHSPYQVSGGNNSSQSDYLNASNNSCSIGMMNQSIYQTSSTQSKTQLTPSVRQSMDGLTKGGNSTMALQKVKKPSHAESNQHSMSMLTSETEKFNQDRGAATNPSSRNSTVTCTPNLKQISPVPTSNNKQSQIVQPVNSNGLTATNQIKSSTQSSEMIRHLNCSLNGLTNIGNTCYMNATLQCLLRISGFSGSLDQTISSIAGNQASAAHRKVVVTQAYLSLIGQLSSSSGTAVAPQMLKNVLSQQKSCFAGRDQQDAQQFLTALLESINSETSRVWGKKPIYKELAGDPSKASLGRLSQQWWSYSQQRDNSPVCDWFQGQLLSLVQCTHCHHSSAAFDNIWSLPLSLPSRGSRSLEELIAATIGAVEIVPDYYCSRCAKHRQCEKTLSFFRLPQVFIVQLKRFEFTKWRKDKLNNHIDVPEHIDLKDALHEQSPNCSNYTRNTRSSHQSTSYTLTGVVKHVGQVDYGHYTSVVRHDNAWWEANDSRVRRISDVDAGQDGYLLFYSRV